MGKASVGVFVVALSVYVLTLAPGLMWGGGDFAKFQTQLFTGEIEGGVHGHPLWVILARPFLWLPIRDVAYRANLASAVFASAALVAVFNASALLARSIGAALIATAVLLVSHTYWTYAVLPKPYSLNALVMALSIYFLLRWGREQKGIYLYVFAILFGLSPLNHLVLLTAAAGYGVYLLLTVRKLPDRSEAPRQLLLAGGLLLVSLIPYSVLSESTGQAQSIATTIAVFFQGFFQAMASGRTLLLGLGLGSGLLLYQFPLTLIIGAIGFGALWKADRAEAAMLGLIGLSIVAFLLAATNPKISGTYVWSLHWYLLLYVVLALFVAVGFRSIWSRIWNSTFAKLLTLLMTVALPVFIYFVSPAIARALLPSVPGFRELPGRDNYAYVLSPWKHLEQAPREFAESVLSAVSPNAVLFADYSIWSMVNYLQVVEGSRPDVETILLPGAGEGVQLPLVMERSEKEALYIGDVGDYYDVEDLQEEFEIVQSGPIYQLTRRTRDT
jgi:hypothetical protein